MIGFRVYPFQIAALVFTIIGFIASWIALLTPAWQVVYAREIQQWIESGLWLNCQTRPSSMLQVLTFACSIMMMITKLTFSVYLHLLRQRF